MPWRPCWSWQRRECFGTSEAQVSARSTATATALDRYEQTARILPLDPVNDDDLARLAPLLDQARALPHGGDEPSWLPAGLSQRDKLAASARTVYRHALQWALLPRLMWRLETQLRGNLNRPDFLYEATRVYLMLGNAGPLDVSLVREWMKLDWQTAYPGLGYAALRDSLLLHLDALLSEPLPQVKLDGELVATARARMATVSMAQRVYSRIRPSAAAQRLPPWRPSDALGPAGLPLFVRASGKRLNEGIPGFFTVDGFHKVLLPSLAGAARSVVLESWVLGNRVAFDASDQQMQALRRDVIALYEADYRPGLGPDDGRPQRGAAAQPVAGGTGPLHPRLARIADAPVAGFHQPTIDAVHPARWCAPHCRSGGADERLRGSVPRPVRHCAACGASGGTSAARPRGRRTLCGAA